MQVRRVKGDNRQVIVTICAYTIHFIGLNLALEHRNCLQPSSTTECIFLYLSRGLNLALLIHHTFYRIEPSFGTLKLFAT